MLLVMHIQIGCPLSYFLYSQMHADDFRRDNYGVVSDLRDGGYSDDMTLAAIAGNLSTVISEPFFIFQVKSLLRA